MLPYVAPFGSHSRRSEFLHYSSFFMSSFWFYLRSFKSARRSVRHILWRTSPSPFLVCNCIIFIILVSTHSSSVLSFTSFTSFFRFLLVYFSPSLYVWDLQLFPLLLLTFASGKFQLKVFETRDLLTVVSYLRNYGKPSFSRTDCECPKWGSKGPMGIDFPMP